MIVAVPALLPVTVPDKGSMLAFTLLLDHVPPEAAFDKVVVPPVQIMVTPVIAEDNGLTVTAIAAKFVQPAPLVTV